MSRRVIDEPPLSNFPGVLYSNNNKSPCALKSHFWASPHERLHLYNAELALEYNILSTPIDIVNDV